MRLPEKSPEPEWNREEVLQHLKEQKKAKKAEDAREGSFEEAFGKELSDVGKATTRKAQSVFEDVKPGARKWGPESSEPRGGIEDLDTAIKTPISKEGTSDSLEKLGLGQSQQKITHKILQGGAGEKHIEPISENYGNEERGLQQKIIGRISPGDDTKEIQPIPENYEKENRIEQNPVGYKADDEDVPID